MPILNRSNYPLKTPVPTDAVVVTTAAGDLRTALVSALANAATPFGLVASIAALKAIPLDGVADGAVTMVTGYYEAGDRGGGQFIYDLSSSAADDLGSVIAPDAGIGRWLRIFPSGLAFCPRLWGAVGDGTTNDAAAFAAAAAYVVANCGTSAADQKKGALTISSGIYRLATAVNLSGVSLVQGESYGSTEILVDVATGFTAGLSTNFHNLNFKSADNLTNVAISYPSGGYLNNVFRCRFEAFLKCVTFGDDTTKATFQNNYFEGCGTGVDFGSHTITTSAFKDNHFNTLTVCAVLTGNAINCEYNNNVFEDCVDGILVNVQLAQSVLINNWAEKAAAATTTFVTDATSGSAFFTGNFLLGNVTNGGATTDQGVNNTWAGTGNIGLKVPRLLGNSAIPGVSLQAGAGGAPASVVIAGSDLGFRITLTTGPAPATSSQLFVVTFSNTYPGTPHIVFAPGNADAAALSSTKAVSPGASSTQLSVNSGAVALDPATVYIWEFVMIG